MSEFTNLLGEIIKEGNLTVYGLAKECDIDRTVLQKAINNGRMISYDTFMKLFEELKNVVDKNRIKELYEKFSEEYYGLGEMINIRFIKQRLNEMRKNEEIVNQYKNSDYSESNIKILANECLEDNFNDNQEKIINEVYRIINEEFKNAEMKKCNPRIWVRFPSDWKFLRKLILYCITLNKNPEKIDFLYCMTGANRLENKDLRLLENYFTACEFAQYGFNTCSGLDDKADAYFELIPYYVITSDKMLAIFKDGSFEISEKKMVVDKMASSFSKIVLDEEFFLKKANLELFSMISLPEKCKYKSIIENICNDIDISIYYDEEIISNAIPKDISEREGLIYIMNFYNESFRNEYRKINFTVDSILKLMNEEHKSKWIYTPRVSKEKKLQILTEIMSEVNDSKVELSMMLSDKIKYHSNLNIRLISERIIVCEGKLYDGEKMNDAASFLISPVINKHLRNYNQYIKNSEYCLNQEQSKRVFEMLVRGLSKKI